METTIYNQKGKEAGKINLPEKIFGVKWNADLVHQVVTSLYSNMRSGTADTKDRSDVRGGGKKPWKQKGTGRARHGSSRSPIWRGGGVTHGPLKEKNYTKKINKKMMAKALFTLLSEKQRSGQILFVDNLNLKEIKTKEADQISKAFAQIPGFEKLGGLRKKAHLAIPEKTETVSKSFRNLPYIHLDSVNNINPLDVIRYKYLILVEPEKCIGFFESKLAK